MVEYNVRKISSSSCIWSILTHAAVARSLCDSCASCCQLYASYAGHFLGYTLHMLFVEKIRPVKLSHIIQIFLANSRSRSLYSVFQKSDAKIEITITATNLIRIKYPLSSFNYHLSGANIANLNKIHCAVFEQQLFKKWNSKTEVSNMEKSS